MEWLLAYDNIAIVALSSMCLILAAMVRSANTRYENLVVMNQETDRKIAESLNSVREVLVVIKDRLERQ